MVFRWISKLMSTSGSAVPTVKFDAARVTTAVRADIWARIQEFEDLPVGEEERVFETTLRSVASGRDVGLLTNALVEMNVPRSRAAYIATYLNNRATSLMNVAKASDLGLTEGTWLYSGAPCYGTNNPSFAEREMDAAHKSVNRKKFPLDKGMNLNGSWTYPGSEPGCKCVMAPVVPGFDK